MKTKQSDLPNSPPIPVLLGNHRNSLPGPWIYVSWHHMHSMAKEFWRSSTSHAPTGRTPGMKRPEKMWRKSANKISQNSWHVTKQYWKQYTHSSRFLWSCLAISAAVDYFIFPCCHSEGPRPQTQDSEAGMKRDARWCCPDFVENQLRVESRHILFDFRAALGLVNILQETYFAIPKNVARVVLIWTIMRQKM